MLRVEFSGRLGNILLINVGASILSKKWNLKTSYMYLDTFKCLGFKPFLEGERVNLNFITVADTLFDKELSETDSHLLDLIKYQNIDFGINYLGNFQNGEFLSIYREEILSLFNLTYDDSFKDDLYIHVRLDDMENVNPGFDYYKKCIHNTQYNRIFLSTDSPNHTLINRLKEEFTIIIYDDSPINTINFAKNFGNIILSRGTFSWWIGLLSKSNNIYYPIISPDWPKIFVFDDWKPIKI